MIDQSMIDSRDVPALEGRMASIIRKRLFSFFVSCLNCLYSILFSAVPAIHVSVVLIVFLRKDYRISVHFRRKVQY